MHIAAAGHTGAIVIAHEQAFTVEETAPCERGIQTRTRVAFGAYKAIPASHMRVFGVDIYSLKRKNRQQIHDQKRSAQVSNTQMRDTAENITANILADFLQIQVQIPVLHNELVSVSTMIAGLIKFVIPTGNLSMQN